MVTTLEILKGRSVAGRNCASKSSKGSHLERHDMLATAEKGHRRVHCVHDITGKSLPWSAIRQAWEEELKYLRDLGIYEKL